MMSSEEVLRLTVAALMSRSGERQGDLAAGIGQSQAQVSRKQSGRQHWSLDDVDLLAAHYRLHALDVLAGPTHAVGVLHGVLPSLQAAAGGSLFSARVGAPGPALALILEEPAVQESADRDPSGPAAQTARAACHPAPRPVSAPVPLAAPVVSSGPPCVLCGQPATDEVDGFPQHLAAEDCAAAVAAASTPAAPAIAVPAPPQGSPPTPPATPALPPVAPAPPPVAGPAHAAVPSVPAVAPALAGVAPGPAESNPVGSASVPPAPAAPAPAAPAALRRKGAPGYASSTLVDQITGRVHDVLQEAGGDLAAAEAALIKLAISDVMALLKLSRVGGRYEHSEFPPTHDILSKKSQKGSDDIWEGRPKWRNANLLAAARNGAQVQATALDMNAAYLSAFKAWLPIGKLVEDTSGVHDPKKAGVHLITPAAWDHTDLPNPLGNRMEPGELWVSESTLRLLLDCARKGLADPPVIHRSLVSGATESLLEKLRRALAETRRTALAENDELTVAYVKSMYSKFVSTIGESAANRELRRPDWMHIIRAKAFANLWLKAYRAHQAGLEVVAISGTDELHVAGDWRSVFPEGRDLNEVKEKDTYILGGKR